MNENELIRWKQTGYLLALLLEIIACLFSFLIFEKPIPIILGVALGGAAGFIAFQILFSTAVKVTEMPPETASTYVLTRYWIRLLCYVVFFLLAFVLEGVNEWGTVAGIFIFSATFSLASTVHKLKAKK